MGEKNKQSCINVCILALTYPPSFGGGGKQAENLAIKLVKQNTNVTVLTTKYFGKIKYDINKSIRVLRYGGENSFLKKIQYSVLSTFWLLKSIKHFHVIHFIGFYWPLYLCLLLSKARNKKIVLKVTLMGSDDPLSVLNRRYGKIEKKFYLLPDIYVSISEAIKKTLITFGVPNRKILSIPNGVDTNKFFPLKKWGDKDIIRESLNLKKYPTKIVCWMGAIIPRKRLDLMIKSWEYVIAENKNIILMIIGPTSEAREFDPSYWKTITDLVNKSVYKNKIVFIENQRNPELYLRVSDLYVHTSINEGFPNTLLEALASGLPSVCVNIPGIISESLQSSKKGIIIVQDEPKSIASNINLILNDDMAYHHACSKAREDVLQTYSLDKISKKYLSLYRSLLIY